MVTLFLPLLAFLFAALFVTGAAMAMSSGHTTAVERRLSELTATPGKSGDAGVRRAVMGAVERLGNLAPRSTGELGKLQQRLVTAGYRNRSAMTVFFGIRLAVAVGLFALFATPLVMRPNLMFALAACGVGYVVPGMVLARMAKARQHRLRLALPDALDLLVVSVEAGLGLDQAIQRVSDELAFAHPDLCDELRLINLELRAGTARADALHNLARRTDLDDVSSLVTMLVQTDKFGTSVAQSLRVHSETLRTKRRQRAEEAAAKTGVKMIFPLVFCVFPAIWIVTIGPAVIKFVQVLLPMVRK
jgi:tight adherence protein C